tara:strand:- start:1116 stop:2312 length:1197 start_codon:yes stop_codon:yes gene_type:complete
MRVNFVLPVSLILILLLPIVLAESKQVELSIETSIADYDVGINTAAISPDRNTVLLIGSEGYVHLISARNAGDRSMDVELNSARNDDFNDVAWHPRGEAALIAGDFGTAMRYEKIDHSITIVNGTGAILGRDMSAVEWRTSGDYAYFGGKDGSVWRFSEGTGFLNLGNDANSAITGISCHGNYDLCVVSSISNGLGVIGPTHNVTWISGTKTDTWIDVDCPDVQLNECVAFGSGLRMILIELNTVDHSKSTVGDMVEYRTLEGDFIAASNGYGSTSIIYLAPSGTVRYDPLNDEAKIQISSTQLAEWDSVVAGRQISYVWETGFNTGFVITSNGNLVSFEPYQIKIENTMLTTIILVAVSVSVPGVILGLIYMNSPFLQRKYNQLRRKTRKKETSKRS